MEFFMSKFLKAAVAVTALAASFAASAYNISVIDINQGTVQGAMIKENPITFNIVGNVNGKVFAYTDEIMLTTAGTIESPSKTFSAFCIDLANELLPTGSKKNDLPANYAVSFGTNVDVSALFAVTGYNGLGYTKDGIDSSLKASALQLAIWEVTYDGGLTGTNNIGTGTFSASGNVAATTLAQTYLNNAFGLKQSGTPYASSVTLLTSLDNPAHQNLVTAVPEPSTYALMAACLGVVGLVSRRKSA
jgi:PEP-CTERM motif